MEYYKYIIGVVIILLLGSLIYYYLYYQEKEIKVLNANFITSRTVNSFFVDIKGEVKKPGVYEFIEGDRVKDALNIAGGLTKKGSTANINLSAKLKSEMVVYIYSNDEIKKGSKIVNCNTKCNCEVIEINNCVVQKENSLININTASLEELLTLPGIGESKANSIIEYRKETKFVHISDIIYVTGIGEALFNNIKGHITV